MPHISNSRSPCTERRCPNKALLTTRIAPLAYSCFVTIHAGRGLESSPFNRYGSTNAEGGIGRKCTDSNAVNHTPRSPCRESCPSSAHLRCLPSPGLEGFLGQANKPLFTLPLPSQGPTHYGVIAHRNPLP